MLGALSSKFLFEGYPGMFGYLVCVLSCVIVINIPGFCFCFLVVGQGRGTQTPFRLCLL